MKRLLSSSLYMAITAALRFRRAVSGQIAFSFAIVALPLAVTIGSALDYGLLVRARSGLQSALDSATLAAAAKQGNLDDRTARSYFTLIGSLEGVKITSVSFEKQQDGTVAGTVVATAPPVFMRIVRKRDYTLRLRSTAKGVFPTYMSRLHLHLDSAKGIYDKEVYWYAKSPGGRIVKKSLTFTYDYSYDPKTSRWTANWGVPPNAEPFSWEAGQTIGLMVVAYADNTGLGRPVNPDVMTTDDADVQSFLRVNGSCDSAQGQKIYWEDQHDVRGDFLDLVMTLTCKIEKSGNVNVRLVQ